MSYYTIDFQIETEETGRVYPQLALCAGANHADPDSILNLTGNNRMHHTNSKFTWNPGAKPTDFVSWGSLKFPIISSRLKHLLSEFLLFDTAFLPIEIVGEKDQEWWVLCAYSSNESLELIDYSRTLFGEYDPDSRNILCSKIWDTQELDRLEQWRKELRDFSEEFHELVICDFHLNDHGNSFDLMGLSPILDISGIIISERLKKRLREEGVSGMVISSFEIKN